MIAAPLLSNFDCTQAYITVRQLSESLCQPLSAEDCTAQSMPDASPLKWHLAHTTWFFETFVLQPFITDYRPFNPAFTQLFNSYYNSVNQPPQRSHRGLVTRPGLAEIYAYRQYVDRYLLALMPQPPSDAALWYQRITLGLHHEQQHQELMLTDLKHLLFHNPLKPVYQAHTANDAAPPAQAVALKWHSLPEDDYVIGASPETFCFDNELPQHRQHLLAFAMANRTVTQGEFLQFITEGGYRNPLLWLSEGWAWVCAQARQCPLYWYPPSGNDDWQQFSFAGVEPLQLQAPVYHLSYFEADAFARWAGARLPTEFEWEAAAQYWPSDCGRFADAQQWCPAIAEAGDDSKQSSLRQMLGNVWEWTQSSYAAYPGFRPAKGAIGEYNGKFMCNQYVLRGGSFATAQTHIRSSYRNFFPTHAQWQFSGLRLTRDV